MVCNTIHLYYDFLQNQIHTPILNLKKEIKQLLINKNIKSTLIIGTPNTIKQGLYKFKNIKSYELNKEEIKQLTNSIFNFNKGINKKTQTKIIKNICQKYLNKGAETIILGCTEFAVMLNKENIPKINTIDILVEATVNKFKSSN